MADRIMFVTPTPADGAPGGRNMLSHVLHACISALAADLVTVRLLPARAPAIAAVAGFIDGVTSSMLATLVQQAREANVTRVVIDGSNLGRVAAALKRALPHLEVLTFCHNVEARFFQGALAQDRSVHALGVLAGNYVAERLAVHHSDRLIALSERDSAGFARWYGRRATDIFPMVMKDQLGSPSAESEALVAADAPALFVGGGFYANRQGIAWFAEQVAPRITLPTIVIGRGMEDLRASLERGGKVKVVGEVDDLSPWYAGARIAIAPIFDGSGMKTKVAEALMFGKRVVGTPEAFSGYNEAARTAGWICETADEFVTALATAQQQSTKRIDPALREIYMRDYSLAAAQRRMEIMLSS